MFTWILPFRLRLSFAKFRLRLSFAKFRLRLSFAKNGSGLDRRSSDFERGEALSLPRIEGEE